ncbi:isopenicillin-N N-acyltransferase-like protein [Brevibacterium sanguinis]|uniref:Isopenicillin-N N-acyltransferase-like protein n=2 Tax=Brevibacterium TaxID=1696 RepID=A0A366IKA6_9MICO|nr:isopenicillin-N N-acyltransferase-like protein [Brevibacterium sanguinis]RBP71188.1 isopenicillin-N N-acyltransferase-like protein [Brevibacterium celere]
MFADRIAETVDGYHELFSLSLGAEADLADWGARAVTAIGSFSPAALAEIEGIARGSQQPVTHLAAINARTEILAACNRRRAARADEGADSTMAPRAGECSTLVHVDDRSDPIAVQVWDWYDNLADSWLVWEIPTASGLVTTVTEFGILGKIGVNTDGIGVLFNILHHAEDGHEVGVPVHVLARTILDTCTDLNQALLLAAGARVSASTSLTVVATAERERTDALGQAMSTEGRVRPPHLDTEAVSIEVNPERIGYHLPDAQGVLVHTNHFLGAEAGEADEELLAGPDTVVRYAGIHRRAHRRLEAKGALTVRDAIAAMDSHVLGGGGSCCHPDAGRPDTPQFASLATISLDIAAGTLTAHAGGPCTHPLLAG